MAERMDELLHAAADMADSGVDYEAMRAGILKKAEAAKPTLRSTAIRLGSIAAALLLLVGAGTMLARGMFGANNMDMMTMRASGMAPQAAEPESLYDEEASAVCEEAPAASSAPEDGISPNVDGGTAQSAEEPVVGAGASDADYEKGIELITGTCWALYWTEGELELPVIEFGGEQTEQSSDERFTVTVDGCTGEEATAYAQIISEWYDSERKAEATAAPSSGSTQQAATFALETDGKLITVEYEDGVMTVTVTYAQ